MGDPSRPDLPMGTVTFLFSDIEASTRLAGELDPATYREMLEQHNRLLRTAFQARAGVERGTQGDAFLVIFREAPSAVGAAVDAQNALAAASWPDGIDVRVRMGIHSGGGIPGGDDYVGPDINRAARIAGAAHGGQVLLSDATRALAERDLPVGTTIRDLGRHRLKDLAQAEHLFQLVVDGLPSEFPPLRSADAQPGNLPVRLTSFIGRERELDELEPLLAESRLLTITGPGGGGKTSLAVELARRAHGRFPDGVWFVALESITDLALVASTIVTALGLREAATVSPAELLREHLRGRRLLLILDNLEQIQQAGSVVGGLVHDALGLTVLATSRAALRLVSEQEYPLAPLPLPESSPVDALHTGPPSVESVDSVRLFVDRARRTQPSFRLTAQNASSVAEICQRLDGLPLGIELAAARVGLLAPSAIAERLAQHLPLPGTGGRDRPDRQQTVERTIAWSYELLGAPERRLLARLSVFAGGWDLEAAELVCGPAAELGVNPLDGVIHLVEQSLVRASPTDPGTRFTMLETVREYAANRLAEVGETVDFRRRHAMFYLGLAESAAQHMPGRGQVTWLQRLAAEQGNLRAATQWAMEADGAEPALRFAAALWRYWQLSGQVSEGLATVESILAVPGPERSPARLRAVEALGGLLYWRGHADRATAAYEQQLTLALELRDRHAQADSLFNLGASVGQAGDSDRTFSSLDEAGRLYRDLGDARGQARVVGLRGIATMITGDPTTGCEILSEAIAQLRDVDDVYFEAVALGGFAWATFMLGRFGESIPAWRQAMELNHALGDVSSTTFALEFSALLAAEARLWEQAATIRAAFEALTHAHLVRPPRSVEEMVKRTGYMDPVVEALGDDRHEAASARGRQMSLEEAFQYALTVSRDAEASLSAGKRG